MPITDAAIAGALFKRVSSLALPDPLPVAWPNEAFTPPTGGRYLAVAYMPNRSDDRPIAFDEDHARQGLLQVSVFWGTTGGVVAPSRITDRILTHFKRGTVIAGEGLSVRVIEAPWAAPAMLVDARLMVPVTIPWLVIPE